MHAVHLLQFHSTKIEPGSLDFPESLFFFFFGGLRKFEQTVFRGDRTSEKLTQHTLMFILKPCSLILSPHQLPRISHFKSFLQSNHYPPPSQPHSVLPILSRTQQPKTRLFTTRASFSSDGDGYGYDEDEDVEEFSPKRRFRMRGEEEEKGYGRGPEFADILGSVLDDPQINRSKVS